MTPSVAGVMEMAFSTSALATGRENVNRKRPSAGTSFWPFLKLVATVVGRVLSYARYAPSPTKTTTTASPTATAMRRPEKARRRTGRLSRVTGGGDVGSNSGSDVDMDNGPRGLCH